MKKANTYRFNIQFRAVTGDQIQVGEFLSSLGRLKSTCIIEAVKQYMMAHPEIAAAALVKVGSPASSGVSPLNAAPPLPLRLSKTLTAVFTRWPLHLLKMKAWIS